MDDMLSDHRGCHVVFMRVTPIQCFRRRDQRASGFPNPAYSLSPVALRIMQAFVESRKVVPHVVAFLDAGNKATGRMVWLGRNFRSQLAGAVRLMRFCDWYEATKDRA